MRQQLSTTTVLSIGALACAAALGGMQIWAQPWAWAEGRWLPGWLAWVLEVAVFTGVLCLWLPVMRLTAVLGGVFFLLALRAALGLAAGAASQLLLAGTPAASWTGPLLTLGPRASGIVFTLLIAYPLRWALGADDCMARTPVRAFGAEGVRQPGEGESQPGAGAGRPVDLMQPPDSRRAPAWKSVV